MLESGALRSLKRLGNLANHNQLDMSTAAFAPVAEQDPLSVMELSLQIELIRVSRIECTLPSMIENAVQLQSLLTQTRHEPRLQGPFPRIRYARALQLAQDILDALHAMRICTTHKAW